MKNQSSQTADKIKQKKYHLTIAISKVSRYAVIYKRTSRYEKKMARKYLLKKWYSAKHQDVKISL